MNSKIREFVFGNPKAIGFALRIYNCLDLRNRNKFNRQHNKLKYNAALLKGTKITIHGSNNEIVIEDFSRLYNCNISVNGNNNRIHIGKRCYLFSVNICIEDDKNMVTIGHHTSFDGSTELAAIEGTKITIGEDCMFSGDIRFRTGDSHSILDLEGRRVNPSVDISIGAHCWIGTRAMCLKGTEVGNNSIVAAAAVLNSKFEEDNCIIGGIPAKVLKKGIDWKRERI